MGSAGLAQATTSLNQNSSEVIYQVYPSSFCDSNDDGVGDLKGITSKLNYLAELGVNSIWISPFFLSPAGPEGDGGYAVKNYREIDPRFGTMDDFNELLDQAHKKGLRIYTDFVTPHSSDQHEWFRKSVNKEPGFEDFYIWRDGKENPNKGERPLPPNNWRSIFGGSAWEWNDTRNQYYLHHFMPTQPVINHSKKEVREAMLGEMRFWLDKGVDGFRLDAFPHMGCDPEFKDDPLLPGVVLKDGEAPTWNQLDLQYSMCPEYVHTFAEEINAMMKSYDGNRSTLGEILSGREGGKESLPLAATFVKQGELDKCYTSALQLNAYPKKDEIENMINAIGKHFDSPNGNCNTASNHDLSRAATRLTQGLEGTTKAKAIRQIFELCLCLPGSFTMYQGEELGLPQAEIGEGKDIEPHQVQDKANITTDGSTAFDKCRDGSRTPMPWDGARKNAGFSGSDEPYLPVPKAHYELSVEQQESRRDTMLKFTRKALRWRKAQPALLNGQAEVVKNDKPNLVSFIRKSDDQTLLCLFNMGTERISVKAEELLSREQIDALQPKPKQNITIEPYSSAFVGDNREIVQGKVK